MISNICADSWIRYPWWAIFPSAGGLLCSVVSLVWRRALSLDSLGSLWAARAVGALGWCPSRNDLAKRKQLRIAELFGGWKMMQIMSVIMFSDVFAIFLGSDTFLFGETSWIYPAPQVGPHVFWIRLAILASVQGKICWNPPIFSGFCIIPLKHYNGDSPLKRGFTEKILEVNGCFSMAMFDDQGVNTIQTASLDTLINGHFRNLRSYPPYIRLI